MNENKGMNRAKLYQLALFPMNNGATNVYFVLILSYVATFGENILGLIGFASVMISLALSVFYMVNGIIANNLASDYASLYYECHTLAPLGFALVAASALGLLLSHLFLADDTN